jgi:hypothetical protein
MYVLTTTTMCKIIVRNYPRPILSSRIDPRVLITVPFSRHERLRID